MERNAYINRIRTAVPRFEVHSRFLRHLDSLIPPGAEGEKDRQKLTRIAEQSAIEERYSVLENFLDGADRYPMTAQRMSLYQKEALPLALQTVHRLLPPGERRTVTHLIITSCTGFYSPGLDIDLIETLDLPPSVERSLLLNMGCYAAIPALKLARHIVRSHHKAKVLVVNIELCSLHWRRDVPFERWIPFLLFADGCAASLVSAEREGLRLDGFRSTLLPQTKDLMTWTVGDDGFSMHLDPAIPVRLGYALQQDGAGFLAGRTAGEIPLWAIHPGGRRILDAVQAGLGLKDARMAASRRILKNFGNMSSPTVMFILKDLLEDPAESGDGCAMAFGPGLSLESLTFHKISGGYL